MREENAFGRVVSAYVELMASGEGPTEAQARALNDLADLAHVFLALDEAERARVVSLARRLAAQPRGEGRTVFYVDE